MYNYDDNMFYLNIFDFFVNFDNLRIDTAMLFILFYTHKYDSKIMINDSEIIFTLDKSNMENEDFNMFIRIFQFITTTNTLTYYNRNDNSWHLSYKHLKSNYKDIFGSQLLVS